MLSSDVVTVDSGGLTVDARTGVVAEGTISVAGVVSLVLFCLAVQGSALLVCRLGGMKAVDSLAVIIEVGFRNMSLAVAVKAVVFPAQAGVLDPLGDAVLFTALLYGGVSLFMSLPAVLINRRLTPASPAPATAGQATSA